MDTFLMICRVCAEFSAGRGLSFKITPVTRGVFVQAPAWVKETRMFKGLLADGSITVAAETSEKKKLENDPNEGVGADGKAVEEQPVAVEAEEEPEEDPEEVPAEEKPKNKPARTRKAKSSK